MAAETKRKRVDVVIRVLREEDAAAVTRVSRQSAEAANWPEESYRELLSSPGAVALVSEDAGRIVGFLVGRQVVDEAEIWNLAVERSARRRGEGSALLKAALDEFRARGVTRVFLEVRESNEGGIVFYAKRGFAKSGRRASYYREPEEAAIVMETKLEG